LKYRKRTKCLKCGAKLPEGSHAKYCAMCGIQVAAENAMQIKAKKGPAYDRWREGIKRMLEETEHE